MSQDAGHPVRLRIVQLLLHGRYTVGELAEDCCIPDNVASEHLRLMQRCGFFISEREGRKVFYQVAEPLLAAGHSQVVNVEGGTLGWDEAGLPVVRGKETMSLERQAGSFEQSLQRRDAFLDVCAYVLELQRFEIALELGHR